MCNDGALGAQIAPSAHIAWSARSVADAVRDLPQAPMTTVDPGVQRVEFSVGDATMEISTDEIRDAVAALSG